MVVVVVVAEEGEEVAAGEGWNLEEKGVVSSVKH